MDRISTPRHVAISRHRQALTIYANDLKKLRRTLERHLGEKTSTTESRQSTRLQRVTALLERLRADWSHSAQRIPQCAPRTMGRQ